MDRSELILISLAVIIILGFLCCVAVLVARKIRSKANPEKIYSNKLMYNTLSYGCIILIGVTWVTNIGWIRIITTPLALIYAIIFFLANHFYSKYAGMSGKMRWINCGFYITYILSNVLLPDAGDTADYAIFFGLIWGDSRVFGALFQVAGILFTVNIILLLIQFIYMIEMRVKKKKAEANAAESSAETENEYAKTTS